MPQMRKAFSIAELMIVMAIIGILAALAMPFFSNQTTQAKESAAKYNLRILRGAIEYYAVRHEGVAPGYPLDDAGGMAGEAVFREQAVAEDGALRKMPQNPFNNLDTMLILQNNQEFPAQATGTYGWIYQPLTKTIRLDWRGTDEKGMRYFDY
jgi:prepilin-type N-terminal cleavage/methylation domain-containing protein